MIGYNRRIQMLNVYTPYFHGHLFTLFLSRPRPKRAPNPPFSASPRALQRDPRTMRGCGGYAAGVPDPRPGRRKSPECHAGHSCARSHVGQPTFRVDETAILDGASISPHYFLDPTAAHEAAYCRSLISCISLGFSRVMSETS